MGEKSMGENLVKSMGENFAKSIGVKRWVKKVWVKNFVESMSENFVKEMGEKRMGENFVNVWVKTDA